MCRIEEADPWEFFTEAPRKARTTHICTECRRLIVKGEIYDRAVGKMDGYLGTYKTCQHCAAASQWLQTACGGFLYCGVLEELEEHWEEEVELRSWTLGRLIIGMRRRWQGLDVPDRARVAASVPAEARS